jgi:hypothetical protein
MLCWAREAVGVLRLQAALQAMMNRYRKEMYGTLDLVAGGGGGGGGGGGRGAGVSAHKRWAGLPWPCFACNKLMAGLLSTRKRRCRAVIFYQPPFPVSVPQLPTFRPGMASTATATSTAVCETWLTVPQFTTLSILSRDKHGWIEQRTTLSILKCKACFGLTRSTKLNYCLS